MDCALLSVYFRHTRTDTSRGIIQCLFSCTQLWLGLFWLNSNYIDTTDCIFTHALCPTWPPLVDATTQPLSNDISSVYPDRSLCNTLCELHNSPISSQLVPYKTPQTGLNWPWRRTPCDQKFTQTSLRHILVTGVHSSQQAFTPSDSHTPDMSPLFP